MYEFSDTIVAVSSPTADKRVIVRISGPQATANVNRLFSPSISEQQQEIVHGKIAIDDELEIDATLYLFAAGHSYTAERLIEIHIYTNSAVTGKLIERFLASGVRMAETGEFTARAYLNGRMDLAQAEAVNKVVTSGNRFQLAAAEKLLAGRLTETTTKAASQILDCLSLLEAGMDFSEEDIEFISPAEAIERLGATKTKLNELLDGSISYETVLDLPTVGIAGATNAGKSSLLNALLGRSRSIVSAQSKTTRDILSGVLELEHCRCVLFDCAGLITEPHDQIDSLAQQGAIGALKEAEVTIFCVDVAKKDLNEDTRIRKLIEPKNLIATATKSDLLSNPDVNERISQLKTLFGCDFMPISSHTGFNLGELKTLIDDRLIETHDAARTTQHGAALTARHKQSVNEAVENITSAIDEIKLGNTEVAAMMLRSAHQAISNIAREHIDEKILDKIFSEFCIGK